MHGSAAVNAEFTPVQVNGCRLWLRSDLDISLVGSKVQAWTDQITRTKYTQTTDANRPSYSAGINGKPKLIFSGSHALFNSSYFLTGPMSAFFVHQSTFPGSGTSVVPYVVQGLASSALRSLLLLINVVPYQQITWKNDFNSNAAAVGVVSFTGGVRAYVSTYNGGTNTTPANYTFEELGASATVVASNPIGSADAFFSSVGAAVDDPAGTISVGSELTGDIYELALWNRPLSQPERDNLYGYANQRYGIHL